MALRKQRRSGEGDIRSVRDNSLRVRRSNLTGSIHEKPSKQGEHEKNQNHIGLLFAGMATALS